MKIFDNDRMFIAGALRVAAETYALDARKVLAEAPLADSPSAMHRLAEAFEGYNRRALKLADRIEDAANVEVLA